MTTDIPSHIHEPEYLESLYRQDPRGFRKAFEESYEKIKGQPAAAFWKARLDSKPAATFKPGAKDITVLSILAILAAVTARMPDLLGAPDSFYQRNIGFFVFPFLAAWFIHASGTGLRKALTVSLAMLAAMLWINYLPGDGKSDTLVLACVHLPLFLWSMTSLVFKEGSRDRVEDRRGYLKYSADLLVMGGLLALSGMIMTGITIGLFELIGLDISQQYATNVAIPLAATLPIIATWLVRSNPALVGKVSPVIAKVFAPLVLVTLVVFLGAFVAQDKDPFNDRDFLVLFNALLIGVLAIVFFAVTEASREAGGRFKNGILFTLAVVTLVVNGIALSAIAYRTVSMGVTPNRLAVLGANILMFVNMAVIAYDLWKSMRGVGSTSPDRSIASFLPWYAGWTAVVVFLFPLVFGYR
jgi:hypothetical protein